jgi:hypothetical protein
MLTSAAKPGQSNSLLGNLQQSELPGRAPGGQLLGAFTCL